MSKERELLKRVLETDDGNSEFYIDGKLEWDIKELLAQPEQEPVAWMYEWKDSDGKYFTCFKLGEIPPSVCKFSMRNLQPLYTSPQKREPLSYEHLEALVDTHHGYPMTLGRAIEEAHGIGVDDEWWFYFRNNCKRKHNSFRPNQILNVFL